MEIALRRISFYARSMEYPMSIARRTPCVALISMPWHGVYHVHSMENALRRTSFYARSMDNAMQTARRPPCVAPAPMPRAWRMLSVHATSMPGTWTMGMELVIFLYHEHRSYPLLISIYLLKSGFCTTLGLNVLYLFVPNIIVCILIAITPSVW